MLDQECIEFLKYSFSVGIVVHSYNPKHKVETGG